MGGADRGGPPDSGEGSLGEVGEASVLVGEGFGDEFCEFVVEAQFAVLGVRFLVNLLTVVADKVHRRKMAREAARGVLPNSTETKIVVTANARAWRTMLELRSSEGAELEIRRCAVAVLKLLQRETPAFFSDFELYRAEDRIEAARIVYHKV